jgi:hypothetical protein
MDKMYRLIIFATLVLMAGCAFRSAPVPDTIKPYYNLYSRNFIVAAPTAMANGVCGAAGGIALGFYSGQEGGFYVGSLVGAHACGAVVGLPFIPLSYLCEENPWTVVNGKYKTTWTCHRSATLPRKRREHS